MNDYEGLNLPQLLDLMRELVLPEPVSRTPEGPGWWIFLGWLVAVIVIIARGLVARHRRNRYRREAIARLAAISRSANNNPSAAAADIAVLLKQAALVAYPRADVAALYGEDWARFLNESARHDPAVTEVSARLATAAYKPGADGRELVSGARRWIEVHRA